MTGMKNRPVAVCTDCITYTFHEDEIGTCCRVVKGVRPCGGIMVDTTDPINWKECSACMGTGTAWDGEPCAACQESGWLLTRRR